MSATDGASPQRLQVALVTGAAGGIGSAIVERLLSGDMRVVAVDRDAESLAALKSRTIRGRHLCTVQADVADLSEMRAAAAAGLAAFGTVDFAVLNAGIEGAVAPIDEYPSDIFSQVMKVNVRGVWCGLQACIPELEKGRGSAVIVSSISGVMGFAGVSAYTASKHAVIGMMRSAALELAPVGVRVNVVAPGFVSTRMTRDLERNLSPGHPEAAHDAAVNRTPLHRYAEPAEIAKVVSFLLSDEASFCTGGVYTADGGFST